MEGQAGVTSFLASASRQKQKDEGAEAALMPCLEVQG